MKIQDLVIQDFYMKSGIDALVKSAVVSFPDYSHLNLMHCDFKFSVIVNKEKAALIGSKFYSGETILLEGGSGNLNANCFISDISITRMDKLISTVTLGLKSTGRVEFSNNSQLRIVK